MRRVIQFVVLAAVLAAVAAPGALAFGITDASLSPPTAIAGTPYSFKLDAEGGAGPPFHFMIQSGSFPPGLTLADNGQISGTPTQAGDFSFWVQASDCGTKCGFPTKYSQRQILIHVLPALQITTSSPLTTATVNQPYSVTLTAAGGGGQTWTVDSGTLPAGLTLSLNGVISGTPTTPTSASFTVKVTDGTRVDRHPFTLDAIIPLAATASTPSASGEVSAALSPLTLTATNGKPPYMWAPAAATTLPAGLALSPVPSNPAQALILGVPSIAGSFSMMLTVTDALGETSTVDVSLTIAAKLAIKTKPLRPAKVGRAYKARLGTTGGVGPFVWRIVHGKLPVGISFDRSTGTFRGVPSKASTFTVYVGVKDTLGVLATTHKFVIKVVA